MCGSNRDLLIGGRQDGNLLGNSPMSFLLNTLSKLGRETPVKVSGIERKVICGDVSKVVAPRRQEEWYRKAYALSL